jgi:uncharacterized protein (DUF697 family)
MKHIIIFLSGAVTAAISYTAILWALRKTEKPFNAREMMLLAEVDDLKMKIENTKKEIDNVNYKKNDNRSTDDIINNIRSLL